ncbi:MAG TPA: 16S rRNA (guanine(966)-N(2))-methyltransferase RsmD [Candidatus Mcinerneyibacteriales bacterium]|nr:16S rRNA (guanine(966)-N(2))-methyltransferase RsmD [Candidatus Mcinerneyibacteriales bacterium]
MRIIAGTLKGRKIISAPLSHLRPTLGRVKETLFALLENYVTLQDARLLDIFAGTGNLGFEALSRGGQSVVFVEVHPESLKLIAENASRFHVEDRVLSLRADCFRGIELLAAQNKTFDVIFMDPPFRKDYMNRILEESRIGELLAPGGVLFCETEKKHELRLQEGWDLLRERQIADSCLYFLKRSEEEKNEKGPVPGNI